MVASFYRFQLHPSSMEMGAWDGGSDGNKQTWDFGGRIYNSTPQASSIVAILGGDGKTSNHLRISSQEQYSNAPMTGRPQPHGTGFIFLLSHVVGGCSWNADADLESSERAPMDCVLGTYGLGAGFEIRASPETVAASNSSGYLDLQGWSLLNIRPETEGLNETILHVDISDGTLGFEQFVQYDLRGELGGLQFIRMGNESSILYIHCLSDECTVDGDVSFGYGKRLLYDPDLSTAGSLYELNLSGGWNLSSAHVDCSWRYKTSATSFLSLCRVEQGDGSVGHLVTTFYFDSNGTGVMIEPTTISLVADGTGESDGVPRVTEPVENGSADSKATEEEGVRSSDASRPIAYLWIATWSLLLAILILTAVRRGT